jgi:hypothetical protein
MKVFALMGHDSQGAPVLIAVHATKASAEAQAEYLKLEENGWIGWHVSKLTLQDNPIPREAYIDEVLSALKTTWHKNQSLPLGQLIVDAASMASQNPVYVVSDADMLSGLRILA